MINIDWKAPLPYDHKGRWEKKYNSIMCVGAKVTWPQFISECIVYNRCQQWSFYKDVKMGPEWHFAISKQVRALVQQAYVLCNYFPHPDDEPLVPVAFKNVFRNFQTTKIGQYRKTRISKNGNQNITKDEKDVVLAIAKELERLINQRNTFKAAVITNSVATKNINEIKFNKDFTKTTKKKSINEIIETENSQ